MSLQHNWTGEQAFELTKLWGQVSTTTIASHIGCGLTKNAIIGKAHRLGLSRLQAATRVKRGEIFEPKPKLPRVRKYTAKPPSYRGAKVMVSPEPNYLKLITIVDLHEDACHWPVGDPSDLDTFRYCGLRKSPDAGPYCSYHHSRSLKAFEESFSRGFACSP